MSKPQLRRIEQKFTENFSVANVFSKLFQVLSRVTRKFGNLAENYWQVCQNHIQWVRRNAFKATSLKQVCKLFNFFVMLRKFPWQQRQINLRVDKTAKNVSSSKLRRNIFQKKKSYCSIFLRFRVKFFLFLAKTTGMVVKTAIYVPFEDFEVKQFLKNCTMFHFSSEFEIWKY